MLIENWYNIAVSSSTAPGPVRVPFIIPSFSPYEQNARFCMTSHDKSIPTKFKILTCSARSLARRTAVRSSAFVVLVVLHDSDMAPESINTCSRPGDFNEIILRGVPEPQHVQLDTVMTNIRPKETK